ncbi:NAD(P)/FAD-dependent oxidoreductase, partial [Arthrobacter sp. SIMBA_036]
MGAIKAGRIAVVREVDRVLGGRVHLAGGEIVDPDILIAATGYGPSLGRALGGLSVLSAEGNPI